MGKVSIVTAVVSLVGLHSRDDSFRPRPPSGALPTAPDKHHPQTLSKSARAPVTTSRWHAERKKNRSTSSTAVQKGFDHQIGTRWSVPASAHALTATMPTPSILLCACRCESIAGDCKGRLQFEPVLPFGAVPPRPERILPHRLRRLSRCASCPGLASHRLPCDPCGVCLLLR